MKDLDITAVFCELLSGLAFMLVVAATLDWSGACSLENLIGWIKLHPDFGTAAALLAAGYLSGLVVDAIGLVFDKLVGQWKWLNHFLGYDCGAIPSTFYPNVSAHVLKYWCEQWAYFSCYRNLLVLGVFGLPSCVHVAMKYGGNAWGWISALLLLVFVTVLIIAVRVLQSMLVLVAEQASVHKHS